MKVYSSIAGLVLAGGRSSRMGKDKARLAIAGKSLYRHMAEILELAGVGQVVLSGKGLASSAIADQIPDKGPLSGIHAAICSATECSALVIVPVDMPLLTTKLIRCLCDYGSRQRRPLCYEGYMLPMFLPVNPQSVEAINQAISSENRKDYSLYRLHQKLNGGTMPIPEDMALYFHNANTPDEWATCLSLVTSIEH